MASVMSTMSDVKLAVVGASIGMGQIQNGVEKGPTVLRQHGLIPLLEKLGLSVKDFGDVSEPPDGDFDIKCYQKLFDRCLEALKQSEILLTLGGDHSIALSSVSAVLKQHPSAGIIWVDAHGDINSIKSSLTGRLHGMPLAGLLGIDVGHGFREANWFKPELSPRKVVIIGVRDLDPGEVQILNDLNILHFSADAVLEQGIEQVLDKTLQHLGPECPLHLSFDIDAMDPHVAPATGVRVPNGLYPLEVSRLGERLRKTGRLVGVDLVELNPDLAQSRLELLSTVNSAMGLLFSVFSPQSPGLRAPRQSEFQESLGSA